MGKSVKMDDDLEYLSDLEALAFLSLAKLYRKDKKKLSQGKRKSIKINRDPRERQWGSKKRF